METQVSSVSLEIAWTFIAVTVLHRREEDIEDGDDQVYNGQRNEK
jgi:hypothetical protein